MSPCTPACPDLLKYSCGINANVRLSGAIRVVDRAEVGQCRLTLWNPR
jgi:hypothetical protein